jgi:hypothetical protein
VVSWPSRVEGITALSTALVALPKGKTTKVDVSPPPVLSILPGQVSPAIKTLSSRMVNPAIRIVTPKAESKKSPVTPQKSPARKDSPPTRSRVKKGPVTPKKSPVRKNSGCSSLAKLRHVLAAVTPQKPRHKTPLKTIGTPTPFKLDSIQGRDSPIVRHYSYIKNPCFVTCVNYALCSNSK